MRNPIDVLFSPGSILLLKTRPGALRRVAEKLKPFLMASVHPDHGLEVSPGLAAEISEAFNVIKECTDEDLEDLILEFSRKQRGEEARIEVRALRDDVRRLGRAISLKERELEKVRSELSEIRNTKLSSAVSSWEWLVTGIPFKLSSLKEIPTSVLPKGAIPRGLLQHFHVVVRHENIVDSKKLEYTGYQFDASGRAYIVARSDTLEGASCTGHLKGINPSCGPKASGRGSVGVLIGSVDEACKEISLSDALNGNTLKPYVAVGRVPVFVRSGSYKTLQSRPAFSSSYTIYPERVVDIFLVKGNRSKADQTVVGGGSESPA